MTKTPFIVIEGADGSGTTTQARLLVNHLGKAIYTNEPTDMVVGSVIRRALSEEGYRPSPRTLALLFAADRQDHLPWIRECLDKGLAVICDRYALSSWVYQGMSLPMPWIRQINANIMQPDLTILLDVDPNVAAARRAERAGDPEIFDADDTQRRVIDRYRELIAAWPGRTAVVAASGDVDEVERAVRGAVEQYCDVRGTQ